MELSHALRHIIQTNDPDIIRGLRLINILIYLNAFQNIQESKYIMRAIIDDGSVLRFKQICSFFLCKIAGVKIFYPMLVGVTIYPDSIEVHKEEAKLKQTVFQGFEAWFVINIFNQVNNN